MSGKSSKAPKRSFKNKKNIKKSESDRAGNAKPSGWEFAPFTTKAVAFNHAAKNLAEYVQQTYGAGISIAAFEKFAIAADGFTSEEAAIVHLEKKGVLLLIEYQKARDARDAERQAFRSDVQVKNVSESLGSLLNQFTTAEQTAAETAANKRSRVEADFAQGGEEVDDDLS